MSRPNKFNIAPPSVPSVPAAPHGRDRRPGPMGAAVREAAESLSESTEAKVEQRRQNAEDARAYHAARDAGHLLMTVPLDAVNTDDLPRDRLDLTGAAASDEMEELKASIRARGQREPVELYRDAAGRLQLKAGWRRVTALRQLHAETTDARFATVVARLENSTDGRLDRYVDMVEENVVRQDLSFGEMAQLAISAASDPGIEGTNADELVGRLYGALHKMKRSYIRSFVRLLQALGPALQWPQLVSRNAGVEVVRIIDNEPDRAEGLRVRLEACGSPEAQSEVLASFIEDAKLGARGSRPKPAEKLTFHVEGWKVTARGGECRFVGQDDLLNLPRAKLERAARAFAAALAGEGG